METLKIENARIGFRNFSGAAGSFNKPGDRNFVVFIEEDIARDLEAQGWNVKWPKPKPDLDPEIQRDPYLPVAIKFTHVPPKVILINGHTQTRMTEDTIGVLDNAELQTVDLIINPYRWTLDSGASGVKAYVKTMYVTLVVDEFYDKYNSSEVNEQDLPF